MATVFVAREALDQTERDVDRALAVAAAAKASLDRELALEARGHLYARAAAST